MVADCIEHTVIYVLLVARTDNDGEGRIMTLITLIRRAAQGTQEICRIGVANSSKYVRR